MLPLGAGILEARWTGVVQAVRIFGALDAPEHISIHLQVIAHAALTVCIKHARVAVGPPVGALEEKAFP